MSAVNAEVKVILFFGPDASKDAGVFEPSDPTHFGTSVQILIGEVGSDLADSFDVTVCSPSWFAAEVEGGRWFTQAAPLGMPETVAVGAGLWFMRSWDRDQFESAVRFLCETYSPGPDWGSVASRIGRQLPWEFDYKYDAHVDERFGEPFPPLNA
jgi:hypothetical protein